jgi:membrane protein implicated in regulation of membrane protease activity
MSKKGEISARKAWLLVLASLIDDVLVLALVFLGLWLFHVEITWWIILIVAAAIIAFIFVIHRAVVPALRREVSGAGGMIGMEGKVTEALKPAGMVKIKGERWKANSAEGTIEIGEEIEVVGINGLDLEVRKKTP